METVAKQRRSVIKRQKKEADKLASKTGPVIVKLNDVPTSNRKMRLVADLIRGKEVNHALSILKFQPKSGAPRLEKLLIGAMADWELKRGKIDETDIVVREIFVDGGKILKRLRPAPQGRAHRIRKRSNHVTLILDTVQSDILPAAKPTEIVAKGDKPKSSAKEAGSKGKKSSAKSESISSKKKTDNK
jgi:large subunit ribosomal protein L22